MTPTAEHGRAARLADRLARIRAGTHRVRARCPRPIRWLTANPQRLLALVWLLALLLVGTARLAGADDIISGPNLAGTAPKTLFERFDVWHYNLTVKPDEDSSGWFDINAGFLQVVGFVNMLLVWITLGLVYGALTLVEWLFGLTLYRDSAGQIDHATQLFATHVFWPLIPATVAIGALIAYTQWRADGRGFVGDVLWIAAAVALACGIAAGPSSLMVQVDGLRTDMASGVISAAGQYQGASGGNPTGYPDTAIPPGTQQSATRTLVSGLWNEYGATPWCFAEFRSLDVCRHAGSHALANDGQWRSWMAQLDANGSPPVFGDKTPYVRGEDLSRTGVLVCMVLLVVPLAYLLLRLVLAGLMAAVGLLLMLMLSLLFLTWWCIPGWFRRVGIQYCLYTLGLELQSLFITAVLSGVLVISTILSGLVGQYGFFLLAILNIALVAAGTRAQSWLDMLTTGTGGSRSGGGMATALLARGAARVATRAVGAVAGAGIGAVAAGAGGAARAVNPTSRSSGGLGMSPHHPGGLGLYPHTGRTSWQHAASGMPPGPVQAHAQRTPQPGPGSTLGSSSGSLPPASPPSGSGSGGGPPPPPPPPVSGPAGGLPSGGGSSGAAGSGSTTGPRGVPPTGSGPGHGTGSGSAGAGSASGSGGASPRPPRGRVWVTPPGGGPSPLHRQPPRAARERRDGSYTITSSSVRPPRRRGRFGRRPGGGGA